MDDKEDKPAARKGVAVAGKGKGKGGKEKAAPTLRTKSAYTLWSADERKKLLEEKPDIKANLPHPPIIVWLSYANSFHFGPCLRWCFDSFPPMQPKDIFGVLAERWKKLSADDKAPYEKQAEELREAAHTRADAEDEEEDAKAAAPALKKRKRLMSKGAPRVPFSCSASVFLFSARYR